MELSVNQIIGDDDVNRRIRAKASTAVVAELLPGLDEWAIYVAAINDDVLPLIRKHATPDVPVHLFYPETLDRIDEVDAPLIIVTSSEALDTSPLLKLRPSVSTLILNGIVAGRSRIDVSALSHVRDLAMTWSEADVSNGWSPSLTEVSLFSFNEKNLDALPRSTNLEAFTLYTARRLESLDGITDFPALHALTIYDGRRLTSVEPITRSTTISEVDLDGCGHLGRIDFVRDMPRLTKLVVSDCQAIATLEPLREHPTLEEFWAAGSTRILDNDLSPLLTIPHLRQLALAHRRDYRPRTVEVRQALGLDPY